MVPKFSSIKNSLIHSFLTGRRPSVVTTSFLHFLLGADKKLLGLEFEGKQLLMTTKFGGPTACYYTLDPLFSSSKAAVSPSIFSSVIFSLFPPSGNDILLVGLEFVAEGATKREEKTKELLSLVCESRKRCHTDF